MTVWNGEAESGWVSLQDMAGTIGVQIARRTWIGL
jgi:hypothetical protein